jgi:hypothetical protein
MAIGKQKSKGSASEIVKQIQTATGYINAPEVSRSTE